MNDLALPLDIPERNSEHKFKELYYYLYSNSSSSRSERILADLSKLILLAISKEDSAVYKAVRSFLAGESSANNCLIPALVSEYPESVSQNESFSLNDEAVLYCLRALSEIDLRQSPSHTFGDAFQALMGPRLRGDKGQFFTPRSVVRAMVEILAPSDGSRLIDPACGTGGFLSAALDYWQAKRSTGEAVGLDKDADMALLASALSTVHSSTGTVSVTCANSLSMQSLAAAGLTFNSFDYVVTNPPFGSKIGITDHSILSTFDLGHVWNRPSKSSGWAKARLVRSSQDPQILFIELCIRLLKKGGKMAIVLPEGIFGNSGSGYIWDYVRDNGSIDALIDCPRTTFQPGTDTKTNILFFTKGSPAEPHDACRIAVAYACGHDKRGKSLRANGAPVDDDFSKIAEHWFKDDCSESLWSTATLSDPYYLVPRYYDQRLADEVAQDAEQLNSPVVSLGELVAAGFLSIRKGHEVGSEAYGTGDVPFVRTSDIHNFEVSHDPTNCVSEETYVKFRSQQNLKAGDILMVVDGRYKIGRCAILHEWNTKTVAQSHLRILSLKQRSAFDPLALLYGLSLPSVQREIRRLVFIQSTLGGLGSRINEIRIPDPRRSSEWGEALERFSRAVISRAEQGRFLQAFGTEVEL